MTSAFPLTWPDNMPRHKGAREKGAFRTELSTALNNARKSLIAFGSDTGKPIDQKTIIFSSNVGGLQSGPPADPGIALWFEWDGAMRCIPVDRYSTPASNLQAIHHIIEADRTKLRHGSIAIVRASYAGFISLPAPLDNASRPWREVLDFLLSDNSQLTAEVIENRYRRMAKLRHPDVPGGSHRAMAELNRARGEALAEVCP